MTAIIGYENLIESASSVTVTSEATGGEKENAYDWLEHDWWQGTTTADQYFTVDMGSAQSADYWAVHAHNVADNSGTVTFQYSSDNFAADTNTVGSAVTPTANTLIFKTFASVSARYWRFKFTHTGSASKVGVLSFGARVDLPMGMRVGFTPPQYGKRIETVPHVSESGLFVGKSVRRREYETELELTNITQAWARSTLEGILTHAETKPFFLSWDETNYPAEVAYCWLRDNATLSYAHPVYLRASLPIRATL